MGLYILLLSTYPLQYHTTLVPWCISLSYFHSILLYSHIILLPKTFYSHTCISSLNAYQISSMNFFLSSIPLYLKHYNLVGLTTANVYDLAFYYFYSFIFTQSLYYIHYISFILIKFDFSSILRGKYNMVFTQPLCMR